jgi:hypothetical protein
MASQRNKPKLNETRDRNRRFWVATQLKYTPFPSPSSLHPALSVLADEVMDFVDVRVENLATVGQDL